MSDHHFRWQLRQLPRALEPARDLWPAIAAAIGMPNARVSIESYKIAPRKSGARWLRWGSGIAAALLLAGVGLSLTKPNLLRSLHAPRSSEHRLVLKEADAIRKHYKAELAQFRDVPVPVDFASALLELDASAEGIRSALDSRPDAVFLLGQLRRTYARRLELTQRLATL
jgi:hypothetical protein